MAGGGGGKKGSASGSSSASSSSSVPSKMRKTVQNLKEVVNCTEQEICAMLRECNMDPNEAVHRLLTQDTFHEVKSKREKKKEVKVYGESRSQKTSHNSSGHGVRGGADLAGCGAPQISTDACEVTRSNPVPTKENVGKVGYNPSASGSGRTVNTSSPWSTAPSSYNDAIGSTVHFPVLCDGVSTPSPSSTLENNWVHGQPSMADIVKMGRHQRKPSSTLLAATEVSSSLSHKEIVPNTSEGYASCISTTDTPEANSETSKKDNAFQATEVIHGPRTVVSQHEPLEEWTLVDDSVEENSPVLIDLSATAVYHKTLASAALHIDGADSHIGPHVGDIKKLGHASNDDYLPEESFTSDGLVKVDISSGSSGFYDRSPGNCNPYQQHDEAKNFQEQLSSVSANLQHPGLHKEEQGARLTEENPAVIIPDHLQVTNADCSHLSFGSFRVGAGASPRGTFLPKPVNSNLEVTIGESASLIDYSARNHEYHNSEQLKADGDDTVTPIIGLNSRNYDVISTSQPELNTDDVYITDKPHQQNITSISSLAFSGTMQSEEAYNHSQENSQLQNLTPGTSLMRSHVDSSSINLFAGNAQPLRMQELSYLNALPNQSTTTKYSPPISSYSGSTTSLPEALKPGLLSSLQSILQSNSSTTIPSLPALPSHLPVPTYSQPTLPPPGPLSSMFTYPVLPQSFAYMPFCGNSAIHQSSASLENTGMKHALPQYKSNMSLNGLAQSLPAGSSYGSFQGSANIGGAFLQNPSNHVGAATGYEETLRSRYKESIPLYQGDNTSLWNSRAPPSLPPSSFYGLQGPSPQGSSILRQSQQPTQRGMMGYPDFYHSQLAGGFSREHQQLPSRGSLGGSQGQSSQQSHQLWQHSY